MSKRLQGAYKFAFCSRCYAAKDVILSSSSQKILIARKTRAVNIILSTSYPNFSRNMRNGFWVIARDNAHIHTFACKISNGCSCTWTNFFANCYKTKYNNIRTSSYECPLFVKTRSTTNNQHAMRGRKRIKHILIFVIFIAQNKLSSSHNKSFTCSSYATRKFSTRGKRNNARNFSRFNVLLRNCMHERACCFVRRIFTSIYDSCQSLCKLGTSRARIISASVTHMC